MSYSPDKIRNICLLGHSGSGKTTLAESLLFVTGAIDRMGKTPDGNTTCDHDPEEVKRQISISLAVAPVEYKGCKINVLDTPVPPRPPPPPLQPIRTAQPPPR